MARIQSFLTIEFSLAGKLARAYAETMVPVKDAVIKAAQKGRWDVAAEIVDKEVSFEPMLALVGNVFEVSAISAYILGAAAFRQGKTAETRVMRGESLPGEVGLGIQTLENQFRDQYSMRRTLVNTIHRELQRLERLSLEEHSHTDGDSDFQSIFKQDITGGIAGAFGAGVGLTNIGANLTTSRLTTFGFLSEANAAGITRYQRTAVLDGKTCPVCIGLHGRIFDVPPALQAVTQQLVATQNPDALKGVPFPSQSQAGLAQLNSMSREELQAAGFDFPPSHPLCRCTLVRVGVVPRSEVLGAFPIGAQALDAARPEAPIDHGLSVEGRGLDAAVDATDDDSVLEAIGLGLTGDALLAYVEDEEDEAQLRAESNDAFELADRDLQEEDDEDR